MREIISRLNSCVSLQLFLAKCCSQGIFWIHFRSCVVLLPRFVYFTFHQALPHTFLLQYHSHITFSVQTNFYYRSLPTSITMFDLLLRGKPFDATTSDIMPHLAVRARSDRSVSSDRRNDRTTIRKSTPPSKPPPAPRKPILKPTRFNALLKDRKCIARTNRSLKFTRHNEWTPIRKPIHKKKSSHAARILHYKDPTDWEHACIDPRNARKHDPEEYGDDPPNATAAWNGFAGLITFYLDAYDVHCCLMNGLPFSL